MADPASAMGILHLAGGAFMYKSSCPTHNPPRVTGLAKVVPAGNGLGVSSSKVEKKPRFVAIFYLRPYIYSEPK